MTIASANVFHLPKQSTLSALYELNSATRIQYHSKQTLIPQRWRRLCHPVLGSVHKQKKTRHLPLLSLSRQVKCGLSTVSHHSVFSPEGFWDFCQLWYFLVYMKHH